jgi:AcrR family transcriptional regulator
MMRKRSAIVSAARTAFLEAGYANTSMDSIAKSAGVGIKTVYRHFENKDDLFSAVMQAACKPELFEELSGQESETTEPLERPWFSKAPETAFAMAGAEYLKYVLSKDQLALFRVVTQDAYNFPELGRLYKEQVLVRSQDYFIEYLTRWSPKQKWKVKDKRRAAHTFAGLLRSGVYEDALHGIRTISEREVNQHARFAASLMLLLLSANAL